MTGQADDVAVMAAVTDRLSGRFPDTAPIEIRAVVDEVYAGMGAARVRDFIPVLVEKAAARRLQGR